MFNINFADDWIQNVDLWYQKRPLYQLSHYPYSKLLPTSALTLIEKAGAPNLTYVQFSNNILALGNIVF